MERCNIVWFDHDFRIHDHPALVAACHDGLPVIGLYVDIQHSLSITKYGIPSRSALQQQALFQVLSELKTELQSFGIPLFVFASDAPYVMDKLREHIEINAVYSLTPRALNEAKRIQQLKLEKQLSWNVFEGRTLLIKEAWMDPLPFSFTAFRKRLEQHATYRSSVSFQKQSQTLHLPIEDDLASFDNALPLPFEVGIHAAHARLDHYLQQPLVSTYKQTRNGMLRYDDSSKLSIHLALGSISATEVHEALKRFETTQIKNESTYWLRFELWWREFFYLLQEKRQNIYTNVQPGFTTNPDYIRAWMTGQTGYPLVDAAMRELQQTGFMSNRGRQNVASFFVHYLKQDWRIGADYFAATLLDFDPSSNYLNWQYVAGVGNDPRDQRIFNVHKQGRDYDPQGDYARRWIPELTNVETSLIYPKSVLSMTERTKRSSHGYPDPIVPMPY